MHLPSLRSSRLPIATILVAYTLLLLLLLPVRSLWLDELMEVIATRALPLRDVISGYAAHSAGQSPLGAIEQALTIKLLGFSTFAARLPAAIAAVMGAFGLWILSRRAGVKHPVICLLVFLSFPQTMRYATEGRPYSQVLCISIWLTVLLFELLETPRPGYWFLYGTLLAVGLYTQPFVVFIPVAHACFLLIARKWSHFLILSSTIFIAVMSYLPWYVHSQAFWRKEINAEQLHFHLQPKLALLIPRELFGTGYIGTILVAALAIYGLKSYRKHALFWTLSALAPIMLALTADALFDYFFAIRQIIFVLPAAAIAACLGMDALFRNGFGRTALGLTAALLTLNTLYAARWFTKPGENWAATASVLARTVQASGCFVALPASSEQYYDFFEPTLHGHACSDRDYKMRASVTVAVSPYLKSPQLAFGTDAMLKSLNFHELQSGMQSDPITRTYVRSQASNRVSPS